MGGDGHAETSEPDGSAGKRIFLVEDHAVFRHGIEAFLRKYQPMCVCTHADGPSPLEGGSNLRCLF
jgi:hypothetical protein